MEAIYIVARLSPNDIKAQHTRLLHPRQATPPELAHADSQQSIQRLTISAQLASALPRAGKWRVVPWSEAVASWQPKAGDLLPLSIVQDALAVLVATLPICPDCQGWRRAQHARCVLCENRVYLAWKAKLPPGLSSQEISRLRIARAIAAGKGRENRFETKYGSGDGR